jgi:hypothetical protein
MLKISAYAVAQPVATGRQGQILKDGWGLPRQTIYLKQNRYSGKLTNYSDIAKYQKDFMTCLENIINQQPAWADLNGWDKHIKIYNDPVAYSTVEIINDIRQHYDAGHDVALSMILRQRYLIRKLAEDIGDNNIINDWDIELSIKNPNEPAIKKFYDKEVLESVAITSGTTFSNLFA